MFAFVGEFLFKETDKYKTLRYEARNKSFNLNLMIKHSKLLKSIVSKLQARS